MDVISQLIISFGDSLADTGNLKQLAKISNREIPVFFPPYGESFLDGSTGRCSNGRLIIDFLGFTNGALKACCGGGGPYHYSLLAECGLPSATVCDQPDTYVSWDGIHLTEAAYKIISKNLYHGPYTTPEFNSLCPTSSFQLVEILTFEVKDTTFHMGSVLAACDSLADILNLGLPLVPPYVHEKETDNAVVFRQGVNYAVAGATALNSQILEARGIVNPMTNASLEVQLEWFKQSLPSICGNASDCRNFIGHSLILMGEIGGNDFNFPMLEGKPIDELKSLVPLVIDTIVSAVNDGVHLAEAAYRLISENLFHGPYTTPRFTSFCTTLRLQLGAGLSSSI
ncbi:SGNH hydrolase-type esterase domain-containing protein [Artemisia annua]|uniref:SGNH hydrolase-type esterase domain-containing protein n=1 Tax=Artemisia annua TaxID=35608 RepID=A0A2U1KPX4_ARTAN|nr:SGNH hydrolase-type esterase domain-containing protein [Artemisia annua]